MRQFGVVGALDAAGLKKVHKVHVVARVMNVAAGGTAGHPKSLHSFRYGKCPLAIPHHVIL